MTLNGRLTMLIELKTHALQCRALYIPTVVKGRLVAKPIKDNAWFRYIQNLCPAPNSTFLADIVKLHQGSAVRVTRYATSIT